MAVRVQRFGNESSHHAGVSGDQLRNVHALVRCTPPYRSRSVLAYSFRSVGQFVHEQGVFCLSIARLATAEGVSAPTSEGLALEMTDISVAFPGVRALSSVSMSVRRAEVHALLGENGAGKSTLVKIATGAQKPDDGRVRIAGRELRTFTPRAAQALGVRVLYQERQIARELSVAHNVLLDGLPGGRLGLLTTRSLISRGQEQLDRLGIELDAATLAGTLTAAQQQLIELARAVHRRAQLVVLDEPTASLRTAEVAVLFRLINNLRDQGTSVLYISHHLHEVFDIADTATVLRNGEKVAEFEVASTTNEELLMAMFDREVLHVRIPRPERDRSETVLEAKDVSRPPTLRATDLRVRRGEILALCGAGGSGASELAEILSGAKSSPTGSIRINGQPVGSRSKAARRGIGFVPADRKSSGLLLHRSIAENLLLSRRGLREALYWPSTVDRTARAALKLGRVRADDPRRAVATLSGGNQQRVIFGRWLLAGTKVLVLDQPTAGVDVAAKFDIYKQLIDLSAEGLAVVLVSNDYEEIACLADRVAVMREGRVVAEIEGIDATPERLYQVEMGTDSMHTQS
jgi:ABC-type sugar transport system ATPase subunit